MHPMAIIGIAVGVGLIVCALSLRSGADEVLSLGHPQEPPTEPVKRKRPQRKRLTSAGPPPKPSAEDPTPHEAAGRPPGNSFAYVRVEPIRRTPWATRVEGLLGLLAIVAFSAATLAAAIYEIGHLINQAIDKYFVK